MIKKKIIFEALAKVVDPELGVNIVDLGLIYEVSVKRGGKVFIKMTFTTPGCPLMPVINDLIDRNLREIPGVGGVQVEITFDPPWTEDKMSEEARIQLGID